MKKSLLFALAIGLMASCTNDDRVTIPDEGDTTIRLSAGSPSLSVDSRSAGSLSAWDATTLYIYAIDKTATNYQSNSSFLLNNEKATAAATTTANIKWADGKDKEYPGNGVFDFYGYHIDDLTVTPTRTTNEIYLSVTIDGSQDLMIAKAALTDAQKATLANRLTNPTEQEKAAEEAKAFSAYTARRGVQPIMEFEHLLSRLYFQIIPGMVGAEQVYIKSIAVESINRGELVVVAKDDTKRGFRVNSNSSPVKLFLQEKNPSTKAIEPLKPRTYNTVDFPTYQGNQANNKVDVGESLLVVPASEYKIIITMEQLLNNGWAESTLEANLSLDGKAFEAGYQYLITTKIYGLQTIDITAKILNWKKGDDINLDPDETFK